MSLDVDNYLHQVSTCKYLPPSVKTMRRISALSTNSTSVGRLVFHKHETNDHLRFLSSGALRGEMWNRAGLFTFLLHILFSVEFFYYLLSEFSFQCVIWCLVFNGLDYFFLWQPLGIPRESLWSQSSEMF